MRSVISFVGRMLGWLVLIAAAGLIIAGVIVPRLTGSTPYTIITSSMQPAYPAGTLVVVRPVDTDTLEVGDVVTIQLESGQDTVVTHRIAAIQHRLDGDVRFVTKGDANQSADVDVRLPAQIRGEVWYRVPYAGHISTALTAAQRGWAVNAIAIGLLGFAGWSFAGGWRERRSGSPDCSADTVMTSGSARR